jgi:hypothetical protein
MKELTEYRANLIEQLKKAAIAFREECLATPDPYTPLEENGWNVHQIAVHTRDIEKLVYGLRARRTTEETDPAFQNFDGEAHMAKSYNVNEPLDELLNGFIQNIESLIGLLQSLPPEAWSRVSRHTTLGSGLTLQTWVEKGLAHIQEHLEQVKRHNEK